MNDKSLMDVLLEKSKTEPVFDPATGTFHLAISKPCDYKEEAFNLLYRMLHAGIISIDEVPAYREQILSSNLPELGSTIRLALDADPDIEDPRGVSFYISFYYLRTKHFYSMEDFRFVCETLISIFVFEKGSQEERDLIDQTKAFHIPEKVVPLPTKNIRRILGSNTRINNTQPNGRTVIM